MATASRMRALDRAHVVEMANDGGRALGSLVLHFPQTSDGPAHAAIAMVVYARQGGFMVAVPGKEDLNAYIEELDLSGASEKPGFYEDGAGLETTRGRPLEMVQCFWWICPGRCYATSLSLQCFEAPA